MKVKQITTYHLSGEAHTIEKELLPKKEEADEKLIESNVINLYPEFTFQTIEGFGGAMTESAAYLLSRMDEDTQERALEAYFGPEGLHIRYIRVPIGSTGIFLWTKQEVPATYRWDLTPDGSYVMVLLNRGKEDSGCYLRVMDRLSVQSFRQKR